MHPPDRVLVVKLASLGDLLTITPALRALRTSVPAAHIGLLSALGLARELRRGNWDTVVLLHHLTTRFGIAKYAALTLGSGARRRVGLDNGRGSWFLTHSAPDHGFGRRHEVDYWLDGVRVLGAQPPLA